MKIKTLLAIIFSVLFLGALGYFVATQVLPKITLFGSSNLVVNVDDGAAQVYLNGKLQGATPLRKEGVALKTALAKVSGATNSWEGELTFTPKTETTVNLELGVSPLFSGGDVIWLSPQSGAPTLNVISDPSGATVDLDGTDVGTAPLNLKITVGAHIIKITKDNYQGRSLNIMASSGYALNLNSHLFLLPLPETGGLASPSAATAQAVRVVGKDPLLASDFGTWAKAISYWQVQQQASSSATFDYFVGSDGSLFDRGGEKFTAIPTNPTTKILLVAYLPKLGETAMSSAGVAAFMKLVGGSQSSQVLILPTGQAWLRIRQSPDGAEIGKADVGKTYTKITEQNGWTEIIFSGNQTGWVSSSFVKAVGKQ